MGESDSKKCLSEIEAVIHRIGAGGNVDQKLVKESLSLISKLNGNLYELKLATEKEKRASEGIEHMSRRLPPSMISEMALNTIASDDALTKPELDPMETEE